MRSSGCSSSSTANTTDLAAFEMSSMPQPEPRCYPRAIERTPSIGRERSVRPAAWSTLRTRQPPVETRRADPGVGGVPVSAPISPSIASHADELPPRPVPDGQRAAGVTKACVPTLGSSADLHRALESRSAVPVGQQRDPRGVQRAGGMATSIAPRCTPPGNVRLGGRVGDVARPGRDQGSGPQVHSPGQFHYRQVAVESPRVEPRVNEDAIYPSHRAAAVPMLAPETHGQLTTTRVPDAVGGRDDVPAGDERTAAQLSGLIRPPNQRGNPVRVVMRVRRAADDPLLLLRWLTRNLR